MVMSYLRLIKQISKYPFQKLRVPAIPSSDANLANVLFANAVRNLTHALSIAQCRPMKLPDYMAFHHASVVTSLKINFSVFGPQRISTLHMLVWLHAGTISSMQRTQM